MASSPMVQPWAGPPLSEQRTCSQSGLGRESGQREQSPHAGALASTLNTNFDVTISVKSTPARTPQSLARLYYACGPCQGLDLLSPAVPEGLARLVAQGRVFGLKQVCMWARLPAGDSSVEHLALHACRQRSLASAARIRGAIACVS